MLDDLGVESRIHFSEDKGGTFGNSTEDWRTTLSPLGAESLENGSNRGTPSKLPPRLWWNPEVSSTLEDTVEDICTLVRNGVISAQLNPQVLKDLGGVFERFAFCFAKNGRSECLKTIFPSTEADPTGFSQFVDLVNHRVRESSIKVQNIKMAAVRHTDAERRVIEIVLEEVREGYKTGAEAISLIKDDFGIALSPFQEQQILKSRNRSSSRAGASGDKKERIFKKAVHIKEELGVDLSRLPCSKGTLFERFASCLLLYKHGPEHVELQRRLPVVYTDLNGVNHACVILDGLIHGCAINEFKWCNTVSNIIESALPQLQAVVDYRQRNGIQDDRLPKVRVVYNEECVPMQWAMRENIWLVEQSVEMGLPGLARPIQDVIEYVQFDSLIGESSSDQIFHRGISTIRDLADKDDLKRFQSVQKCLQRLIRNGEVTEKKLELLLDAIDKGEEDSLGPNAFGVPRQQTPREQEDQQLISNIIRRSRTKAVDRVLIDLFEQATGERRSEVTSDMTDHLEQLSENEFSDICLCYYTAKEHRTHLSLLASKQRRDEEDRGSLILTSYGDIHRRKIVSDLHRTNDFFKHIREDYGERLSKLLEQVEFHNRRVAPVSKFSNNPAELMFRLTGRRSLQDNPEGENIGETARAFSIADGKLRQEVKSLLGWIQEIKVEEGEIPEVREAIEERLNFLPKLKKMLREMRSILGQVTTWRKYISLSEKRPKSKSNTRKSIKAKKIQSSKKYRRRAKQLALQRGELRPINFDKEAFAASFGLSWSLKEYDYAIEAIEIGLNLALEMLAFGDRKLAGRTLTNLIISTVSNGSFRTEPNLPDIGWDNFANLFTSITNQTLNYVQYSLVLVHRQRGSWIAGLENPKALELPQNYFEGILGALELKTQESVDLNSEGNRDLHSINETKILKSLDGFRRAINAKQHDYNSLLEIDEDLLEAEKAIIFFDSQRLAVFAQNNAAFYDAKKAVAFLLEHGEAGLQELLNSPTFGLHFAYDYLNHILFQAKILAYGDNAVAWNFLQEQMPREDRHWATVDGCITYLAELHAASERNFSARFEEVFHEPQALDA